MGKESDLIGRWDAHDWAVVVLLVVLLGVQLFQAVRPPQAQLMIAFSDVLGKKEASIIIMQAQLQQMQEQLQKATKGGK